MAGFGYDIFIDRLKSVQMDRKSLCAGIAILLITILFFILILILKGTVAGALYPGSFGHKTLQSVFAFQKWRIYLPFVIAVTFVLGYYLSLRSNRLLRFFPGVILALTVLELCAMGWGYNPVVNEADILPVAPAVDFLQKRNRELYRILTTDGYFYPNYGAAYGIADVAGYDAPVYQSFSDLYRAQGGRSVGGQIDSRQQWDPNWPLIDFLNIRYVISPRDLPVDKYKMLFENRYFALYENLNAMPRAFMVYDSEVVSDRKAMLDKMLGKMVNLRSKVLLEEALQTPLAAVPNTSAGNLVKQVSYATDEVVLQVISEKPGLLVMSDLYTPDWHALVDGRETKLYRADYAYRAVTVPEGQHTITFRYSPLSYTIGATMTLFGIVVLLFLCGLEMYTWRNKLKI